MSGSNTSAYATYTFTKLAPGNYGVYTGQFTDVGSSHPASGMLYIYDGNSVSGNMQLQYGVPQTGGYAGTVYVNSGTLTVRLAYSGPGTECPVITISAGGESEAAYASGSLGGMQVSQDPVAVADGKIEPCNCAGYNKSVPKENNLTANRPGANGNGEDLEPDVVADINGVDIIDLYCEDTCPCSGSICIDYFLDPCHNYLPVNGTKDQLVDDSNTNTYVLTRQDGSVCLFHDFSQSQYPGGSWYETISASGQVSQATSTTSSGDVATIQDSASARAQANESDLYSYIASGPNAGLLQSITYRSWDATANNGQGGWVNTSQATYTYYVTGDLNGLTGDLESVTTQYWNAATQTFTGSDTYYYRYYVGPTYLNGNFVGFANGLEREILPNSYSKLAAAVNPTGSMTPDQVLAYSARFPTPPPSARPQTPSPTTPASITSTTSTSGSPWKPSSANCGPRPTPTPRAATARIPTPGDARPSRRWPTAAPTPSTPTTSARRFWTTSTIPTAPPSPTRTPSTSTTPATR